QILIDHWRSLGTALRLEACQLLLQHRAATLQFLAAIEKGDIDRALIDLSLRQRLLEHADPSIKSLAAKLFSIGTSQERLAAISTALEATRSGGDAADWTQSVPVQSHVLPPPMSTIDWCTGS
ncbi:MAG: hypothetical protein WCO31_01830, partial [Actinomycetes bacterium]